MKQQLKIAIYSGDIPSTTFIERLIKGVSETRHEVYLFGFIKNRKVAYNRSVSIFGYQNTKIHKGLSLIKYSILLFIFKNKQKSKLDKILRIRSKNVLLDKVKSYPVLWCQPDVFHLQWAKGLDDWIWVKEFGIKLVLSLRGAHINYSPIADAALADMYRKNFPKVDAFHAVSKAIAKEAETYGAIKSKTKVVYSGLNIADDPKRISQQQKTFQIISVGRPHWKKGYNYALDALKILKNNGLKFKYIIIGGDADIELAYQVHDLKLKEDVILLGQLPFKEVIESIKQSNLLLLPSVEEGIANVVLEAMALKTLVLTTDCGGMKEAVTDGENGFVTPIRDSENIAKCIIEIANLSEDKKESICKYAIETIAKNHSVEGMVNGMIKIYEEL